MEPKLIENTALEKWMRDNFKKGLIPYVVLAIISFFFVKIGLVLTILYVGVRTELMISALRYGDTVNSRRLESVEEKLDLEVDYDAIHQAKG
jgi:hypothetical protein